MLKKMGRGLIAGVIATAAMDASQTSLIPAVSTWIDLVRGKSMPSGAPPSDDGESSQPESSPEKVAHRIADLLGMSHSRQDLTTWGNRVHWMYGAQWGIAFAALPLPRTPLFGALFGAALWLGSDEMLLWALGIAKRPTAYPFAVHASALVAHMIYGSVAGITLAGLEAAGPRR